MKFYVGLHQPSDAQHFSRSFVSINRLRERVGPFPVGEWIMDSGAFSTIEKFGYYPDEPDVYAAEIRRWAKNGNLVAAVAQDFMCEDEALARTGLHDVGLHQIFTTSRYEYLKAEDTAGVYIMPVLQGRTMGDYVRHLAMYEEHGHLPKGAWVGVGSVCKRNSDPTRLWMIFDYIKEKRPDLRLHGFGVKTTALQHDNIRDLLWSADSMAWSFDARQARNKGDLTRDPNDWREAMKWAEKFGVEAVAPSTLPAEHGAQGSLL